MEDVSNNQLAEVLRGCREREQHLSESLASDVCTWLDDRCFSVPMFYDSGGVQLLLTWLAKYPHNLRLLCLLPVLCTHPGAKTCLSVRASYLWNTLDADADDVVFRAILSLDPPPDMKWSEWTTQVRRFAHRPLSGVDRWRAMRLVDIGAYAAEKTCMSPTLAEHIWTTARALHYTDAWSHLSLRALFRSVARALPQSLRHAWFGLCDGCVAKGDMPDVHVRLVPNVGLVLNNFARLQFPDTAVAKAPIIIHYITKMFPGLTIRSKSSSHVVYEFHTRGVEGEHADRIIAALQKDQYVSHAKAVVQYVFAHEYVPLVSVRVPVAARAPVKPS